jgi:hypothetical protein
VECVSSHAGDCPKFRKRFAIEIVLAFSGEFQERAIGDSDIRLASAYSQRVADAASSRNHGGGLPFVVPIHNFRYH